MQTSDKVLNMLGMAQRAGKVAAGEFSAEKMIQSGKARSVLVAEDASDNTKKRFRDKCLFYNIPFAMFATKDRLGHAIGKEMRAVIALSDEGLSKAVFRLLEQIGGEKHES